ncbi:hypothetical protein DZF91_38645 [Actinomadura logoneensis]|uniref:Transmembrane protein n=1 Tax=Actinomadura logoneensis TaxID=2293572 RepID=A0A372J8P2_9ACTN|nr:hypothetical protein [Actinomadura logoneensis]RFU36361.1 hypothetical protein DZF91_38645 [Actinomadura logoneensis]
MNSRWDQVVRGKGLAGIGAVFFGGLILFTGWEQWDSSSVECGGKQMLPGDRCVSTTNGAPSGDNSYAEQRSDDRLFAALVMGGGAAVACGGLVQVGIVASRPGKSAPMNAGPFGPPIPPPVQPMPGPNVMRPDSGGQTYRRFPNG